MTPQELKNSILQLAIQGKLVEQRPEEGTAAELLEKILAERYGTIETRGTRAPTFAPSAFFAAKIFSNSSLPVPSSARCSTSLP